jgi:hypothetical protein
MFSSCGGKGGIGHCIRELGWSVAGGRGAEVLGGAFGGGRRYWVGRDRGNKRPRGSGARMDTVTAILYAKVVDYR